MCKGTERFVHTITNNITTFAHANNTNGQKKKKE